MDLPVDILDADSVAIHSLAGEGLSFYPDYDLLEELFSNPALISRRRYRETLSGFLGDPDISPEPLRRLAARDPAKASTVFARLLKRKQGFRWEADGEKLLRKHKPSYFDGTLLPAPSCCPTISPTRSAAPAQNLTERRMQRYSPGPGSCDALRQVWPGSRLPSSPSRLCTTWRARSRTAGLSCRTKLASAARMMPFSSKASRSGSSLAGSSFCSIAVTANPLISATNPD